MKCTAMRIGAEFHDEDDIVTCCAISMFGATMQQHLAHRQVLSTGAIPTENSLRAGETAAKALISMRRAVGAAYWGPKCALLVRALCAAVLGQLRARKGDGEWTRDACISVLVMWGWHFELEGIFNGSIFATGHARRTRAQHTVACLRPGQSLNGSVGRIRLRASPCHRL